MKEKRKRKPAKEKKSGKFKETILKYSGFLWVQAQFKKIPFEKIKKFVFKYTGLSWLNKQFKRIPHHHQQKIIGLLFILPWLIGLYFFGLQPFFSSIRISLAKSASYVADELSGGVRFVLKGWTFNRYIELFNNQPKHVTIVLNVFFDVALVVPLVLIFSLVLALMLNQNIKGKGIFRVIFFIPVILLSGSMLYQLGQYNLLSAPAVQSGFITAQINRYLPAQFASIIITAFQKIVLVLWLSGVQTLIFLAGLQKRDKAIYEAAAIDGASMWESFWKITLPGLQSLMIINIVYTTVIYANLSNNELNGLIRTTLTEPKFGRAYSSMLAWVLFIIELVIIGFYTVFIKLSNKRYN